MSYFDLLTDPWIPVQTLDGVPQELGLLACFEGAHQLREVADQSPLVTFGIHRLLSAVLQAYLPIADVYAWADEWEKGSFDSTLIDAIRADCAGRMRLFDAERPFYQSREVDPRPPKRSDKTIGYLRLEASTGTNVTHFSHAGDADHAYCPACCARWLVTLPAFALAGGAGIRPSINGVPPFYVLPRGTTLFRTLMLNHVIPPFLPSLAHPTDPGPLWARDEAIKDELRGAVGFVESLTWPPRQVRLFPEGAGTCSLCGRYGERLVRKMHFAQGWYRDREAPVWDDSWGVYDLRIESGQKVRVQRRPREGRDVWRDFALLFLARADSESERTRPAIARQIAQLDERDLIVVGDVRFDVFGLRTDMKAKVFQGHFDGFEFPAALLRPGPGATIAEALELAEKVATQLVYALRELHPESEREKKDRGRVAAAIGALTELWERRYWQRLEPVFRRSLNDDRLVAFQADQAEWLDEWRRSLRLAGGATLDAALDAAEADADGLRRQVAARRSFYGRLKEVLATPSQEGRSDA